MQYIYDRAGKVISRSKNLAGIRRYVNKHGGGSIKLLEIKGLEDGRGHLEITFKDGSYFSTFFGCYEVLLGWVYRWWKVAPAPMKLNGVRCRQWDLPRTEAKQRGTTS